MARGNGAPKNPAPVSGPGKLSRRTDGGAGNKGQPLRTPTGGDYGAGKALTDQQKGAPLANPSSGGAAGPASGGPPPELGPPTGDVFGATARPGEAPTMGASLPGQLIAQDVDAFLRVLYSQFPHPGIAMLMRKDM